MNNDFQSAFAQVQKAFPFPGYIERELGAYRTIAETALKYLKPGDSVLDFGAGPADKTAVLQVLGFRCHTYDDLSDHWHLIDGNRQKILDFARQMGIEYNLAQPGGRMSFAPQTFNMVMFHDVIEHLHDSPRVLVNDFATMLKPGGYLFITVPNLVNLRKRIDVLRGRTNLPQFDSYYWYPDPWRGHVREYTRGDLEQLTRNLGFELTELRSVHHMMAKLPGPHGITVPIYRAVTSVFPGLRDTWLLVARKPQGWTDRRKISEEEFRRILGPIIRYQY